MRGKRRSSISLVVPRFIHKKALFRLQGADYLVSVLCVGKDEGVLLSQAQDLLCCLALVVRQRLDELFPVAGIGEYSVTFIAMLKHAFGKLTLVD